jgi:hypothetical protein
VCQHKAQVCKREDSETYAKRTITEIETCLGFRFGRDGAAPPEDEMIDETEIKVGARLGRVQRRWCCLRGVRSSRATSATQPVSPSDPLAQTPFQNLNSQVEAALAQGLSFKDKFRTSDRRRVTASDVGDEDADGADVSGSGSGSGSGEGDKAREGGAGAVVAAAVLPAAGAPAGVGPAANEAAAGPKKKLGGLKLAVGSQMDTGEWTSHGQFLKRDKPGTQIPGGLQQIKVEDLVKVGSPQGFVSPWRLGCISPDAGAALNSCCDKSPVTTGLPSPAHVPAPPQVKELGRGCFGSVWLAKWRGVEVALKEMLHQASYRRGATTRQRQQTPCSLACE